ncbi:MAG: hypothetical protein ABWY63_07575, partial [Hyphomicrobiaceae bacterium]
RLAQAAPAVTFQAFLGNDFPAMTRNQVRNLQEQRIRTVSYLCQASKSARGTRLFHSAVANRSAMLT